MFWHTSGIVSTQVLVPSDEQCFGLHDVKWAYEPHGHGAPLSTLVRNAGASLIIAKRDKILATHEMLLERGQRVVVEPGDNSVCFCWFSYLPEDQSAECCFFLGLSDWEWANARELLQWSMQAGWRLSLEAIGTIASEGQSTDLWPNADQFEAGEALPLFDFKLSVKKAEL